MKVNINRKFAIIATIGLACVISVILVACGSKAGSDDDEAVQPKAIAATRGTTAETEATTTTTTTEASTSEPEIETKTTKTTTTTEVIETSEPEVTTTVDTPDETGIVTMADNPDGMYPMSECFRRKVEEVSGSKVVNIEYDTDCEVYVASVEDGRKFALAFISLSEYENGAISSMNHFFVSTRSTIEGMDGVIAYTG